MVARWLTVVALAAGGLATAPASAQGACIRWVTCGSWDWGDGGGGGGSTDPLDDYDSTDPHRPDLGRTTSKAGGRISIEMRAEKGSKVDVRDEYYGEVASATATGRNQTVRFRSTTGKHTFRVTATDDAGNWSKEATVHVKVDADPPKLRGVAANAGTATTGVSTVTFTSEPGATWTLATPGRRTLHAKVKTEDTRVTLWLPNGTYRPTLSVRDRIGNQRHKTLTLRVNVLRPLLRVTRTSMVNARRITYAVTGTPRSTGRLVMAHHRDLPFRIDDHGTATIAFAVADGPYGPGTATLTDFAGRRTTLAVPQTVIDTTPPTLTLVADQAQAQKGTLALSVVAEPGSTVRVTSDLHGATLDETATAVKDPLTLTRTPQAGTYTVSATAQDAAGNVTTRQAKVTIVVPVTPEDIALTIAVLLLICLLAVLLAVIAWRQRHRLRDWRARRALAAQQRAAQRAAVAERRRYEARCRDHEKDVTAYRAADADWVRTRHDLAALLETAETHEPSLHPTAAVKLRRGETCYGGLAATMVEERSRQGSAELIDASTGQVMITSQRLLFAADKNREWAFDNVQSIDYPSPDLMLLQVSNRKNESGVRVAQSDTDRFRLLLELALADASGERADVVSHYRDRLAQHDQTRPVPPTAPQEPLPTNLPQPTAISHA